MEPTKKSNNKSLWHEVPNKGPVPELSLKEDAGIVSDGGVTWAEAEQLSKAMGNRECDQTFLAGAPVTDNDAAQLRAYGIISVPAKEDIKAGVCVTTEGFVAPTYSYDEEASKRMEAASFKAEMDRKLEEVRVENARKMYQNSFGRIEGVDVEPARKDDEGKPRWSLLPWRALAKVVEVLEYGAGKYRAHAWVEVESAEDRYKEALLRHVAAFASGELIDPESGKSHLAHIACNALFLLHFSE